VGRNGAVLIEFGPSTVEWVQALKIFPNPLSLFVYFLFLN
jgi:hypothetical protein